MMQMTRRTAARMMVLALAALPLTGCSYNRFVSQEEAIKAQWAQVQNQLQRRNDLIPEPGRNRQGLRGSTKKACSRTSPRRARGCWRPRRPRRSIQAANQQTSALGRLLAVVENYPQLQANEQFNRLMDELVGHREPHRRRADALQRARPGIQHVAPAVPGELTAKMFSFKDYPFFEAPPEAKQVPKVNFTQP